MTLCFKKPEAYPKVVLAYFDFSLKRVQIVIYFLLSCELAVISVQPQSTNFF